MRFEVQEHHHVCDCSAHQAKAVSAESTGLWSLVLPLLACAVCPACLATYSKILSVFGVGFGLSETHHLVLLVFAITVSVAVSAWRSWRTKRRWPVAVALTGSALVLLGHFGGDLHFVEWTGVAVLLVGGFAEQLRLKRQSVPALVERC